MEDWRAVLERAQQAVVDRDLLSAGLRTVWPDVEIVTVESILGGLGSVLHRVFVLGAPVRTFVLRQRLAEFGDDAGTLRRELVAHRHLPPFDVPGLSVLADVDAHADRLRPPAAASELVDPERVRAHLDAHRRWFVPRRQVVHCDLHGGNVLWDGVAATGVLDWPGIASGVAACDEAYAWLDATLALGPQAGDALHEAIDERRRGPAPDEGEVRLWRAVALRRAMPTPGPWAESYRAAGIDVGDAEVEEHYVRLVEDQLGGT